MSPACERAQRLWLREQDGTLGRWRAFKLKRHLATCLLCRVFVDEAAMVTSSLATLSAAGPGPQVQEALHAQAASELDAARQRVRDEEARRFSRALVAGTVAAAVAGLLVAVLSPGLFQGHQDPARQIDERLALIQQELSRGEPPSMAGLTRLSLDDRLKEMEQQLHCLELEIDNLTWNSLQGGEPCADS